MKRSLVLLASLFAAACATAPVDLSEERRVVGTEAGVRLDGFIQGDALGPSNAIPFKYDITNERPHPIAIADLIPSTTYDPESRTVTVNLGSEVPGAQFLPRLISIAPGEKKTFSGTIRVQVLPEAPGDPRVAAPPRTLQLRLNFLGDVQPFAELVGIPQRAVNDPQLADRLFPLWLERNEVVLTGTVPMRWRPSTESPLSAARKRPGT